MNISYSFGMVDLLHFGHVNALRLAAENADLCVFGLVSDEASDAWFGAHVSNEAERRAVLESIKYVDRVVPQRTFDPIDNLRALHEEFPDACITLFHGDDFGVIPARRYLERIGGRVVTFDYYDKLSPQRILDTLNRDDTEFLPGRFSNLISTKANTLLALQKLITKARIEDILVTTAGEFRKEPDVVAENIAGMFPQGRIVIRSSSTSEDAFSESNAGHFKSVIGVDPGDRQAVMRAVKEVIDSYEEAAESDEQILIQRQTEHVRTSGVIFTHDIQRGRPYYVINYNDTGSTDAVTSGLESTTVWMLHSIPAEHVPQKWTALMEAIREIEEILPGMLLDIEFAVTDSGIVIFQVRPLAAAYKLGRRTGSKETLRALKKALSDYERLRERWGDTHYSDMAFWNPSEMIGDNPKNLDYSLYRQIITRAAWDEGIVPLGYRKVDRELMVRFGNKPYISLEASFLALIPAAISHALADRILDYDLRTLRADKSAHDKIEFEIAVNCFDFSLEKKLMRMAEAGFEEAQLSELAGALRMLTENIITDYPAILSADLKSIRELERIRLDIRTITERSDDFRFLSRSIRTLLDAVSTYGTPQFSRQARCAFIAKSLYSSLLSEDYIDADTLQTFLSTIRTVSGDYERDSRLLAEGRLSVDEFCAVYGHLRAGTYNIRTPRYDELQELYSVVRSGEDIPSALTGPEADKAEESDAHMREGLSRAIEATGFSGVTPEEILYFIRETTKEREYFKFIFTRSLSCALELIKRLGACASIDVRDMSWLEVQELYAAEYYSDLDSLSVFWRLLIGERREQHRIAGELILPSVICGVSDFDYIENPESRPSFITTKIVTAPVLTLRDDQVNENLAGKIINLEKADPGYDWIFTRGIAGLITKYGGAASHMAIRCAEFGIPAAIGCGGRLYGMVARSEAVTLDCRHERLTRATGGMA